MILMAHHICRGYRPLNDDNTAIKTATEMMNIPLALFT